MIHRNQLASLLATALLPYESPIGVAHSIREQILVDALEGPAPPSNLRELLGVLGADPRCANGVGSELLAALRRRAIETPELSLEKLAAGTKHRPGP